MTLSPSVILRRERPGWRQWTWPLFLAGYLCAGDPAHHSPCWLPRWGWAS